MLAVVAAIVFSHCTNEAVNPSQGVGTSSGYPAVMQILSGDKQSGVVGTQLAAPLVVRVLDSTQSPVQGQLINFRVVSGGGSVFAGASITNDSGTAQELWTLGTSTAAADSQQVQARAVNNTTGAPIVFAVFRATALPGPPASLTKVSGDNQSAPPGTPLGDSLVIKVADQYNNPAVGVATTWTIVSGSGTVSPATSATNGVGVAETQWSPGAAGTDTVRATVTGVGPVTFSASLYITVTYSSVSAGLFTSCGLGAGGAAYCWGDNGYGGLGNPTTSMICSYANSVNPCSPKPVPVTGGLVFSSLATSGSASCGISAGVTYCWGNNVTGLLGNGTWGGESPPPQFTPSAVAGGLVFSSITVAEDHVCGLTSAGAAYCWGSGPVGALGRGIAPDSASAPVAVSGGLTFVAVGAGVQNTCGIAVGGAAYCWGGNQFGELGDGTDTNRLGPVLVTGGLSFVAIAVGTNHTCALTAAGLVYCWGQADLIGDSASADTDCAEQRCSEKPMALPGGLSFASITAGYFHTCALTAPGAAYCWGVAGSVGYPSDGSALGDGTTSDRLTPVPVVGGYVFRSIAAGVQHTCAVTLSGSVYCWGSNGEGQLGNGSTLDSTQPVLVTHP